MPIKDSANAARQKMKDTLGKYYTPLGWLVAFVLLVGILWVGATGLGAILKSRSATTSPFLDYMPDAPRPCPSDYRCGGVSREQVKMEKQLYANLLTGSKYALPETMTMDAYDVIASEAEPTSCMIKRASNATEAPPQEGQYTPWDEIESGFLNKTKKKPLEQQPTKTLG